MADAIVSRPGLKQGGSDANELFLALYGGEVLKSFNAKTIMKDTHRTKTLSNGGSYLFPVVGDAATTYHTPGTEILGGQIPHTEIKLDSDDALIAPVFIAKVDEALNHYDVRAPYVEKMAIALNKAFDTQVIRAIAKSARSAATFTGGPTGTAITSANAMTDATSLYNAILDGKLKMEEKEVPVDDYTLRALLKPAQWSLLARSDKFINRDFNGGGANVQKLGLQTVDGILLLKSAYAGQVFGVNDTSNANIPAYYRANFTNTAAVMWTEDAVGTVVAEALNMESEYQVSRRGTLINGAMMTGTRVLRPECAVEIKTA